MAKILIAEDELLTREFVVHILRQGGFTPIMAPDGEAAFALAQSEKPDLILLDVMMPFADGFEVMRRLKAAPELSHIPVIVFTAKRGDTVMTSGFDLGAADYISKPFSPAELLARVRKALRTPDAKPD